jgi:DNA-binding LytR/AlgR family response regulator
MENSEQNGKICPYALSGYPQRITFIRKKEKPIDNITDIYYVHSDMDYVEIICKDLPLLINNATLGYMKNRMPPCLFFCCGQRDIVNMRQVKRCCLVMKRIKLTVTGHEPIYVSRLRIKSFLFLLTIYPHIKRGAGIPAGVRIPKI